MGGFRIGEVADATGFTTSTLRYYEDEGLPATEPAERRSGRVPVGPGGS